VFNIKKEMKKKENRREELDNDICEARVKLEGHDFIE